MIHKPRIRSRILAAAMIASVLVTPSAAPASAANETPAPQAITSRCVPMGKNGWRRAFYVNHRWVVTRYRCTPKRP